MSPVPALLEDTFAASGWHGAWRAAAAGALIVLLPILSPAQLFLLGAEFTRAWARVFGSHADRTGRDRTDATEPSVAPRV